MKNDAEARFRSFFQEHYEAVLAYTLRRIESEAAEDLVAETFLIAWRRYDSIPEDPLPWLYTVARNLILNHGRRMVRRDAFLSTLRDESTRERSDPAEDLATRSEILAAFRRLSSRDRETLALVAWEGLTAPRAAKVLGCSVGAFWVRLHRARRRLSSQLESPRPRSATSIVLPDLETEQR